TGFTTFSSPLRWLASAGEITRHTLRDDQEGEGVDLLVELVDVEGPVGGGASVGQPPEGGPGQPEGQGRRSHERASRLRNGRHAMIPDGGRGGFRTGRPPTAPRGPRGEGAPRARPSSRSAGRRWDPVRKSRRAPGRRGAGRGRRRAGGWRAGRGWSGACRGARGAGGRCLRRRRSCSTAPGRGGWAGGGSGPGCGSPRGRRVRGAGRGPAGGPGGARTPARPGARRCAAGGRG